MLSKISIVSVLLLITFLVGIFWYVLHNKTKDVSDTEPYVYFLNTGLTTGEEMLLTENTSLPDFIKAYPKALQQPANIDTGRVSCVSVPLGSKLVFTKAIHHTNAVSGNQFAFLLGTVTPANQKVSYAVVYHYGTFKSICLKEPCHYWEYEKEFWK